MVAGATGKNEDAFNLFERSSGLGTENAGYQRLAVTYTFQRVRERLRLLVNFLLHVMTIFAQLHACVSQFTDVYRTFHRLALGIENPVALQAYFGHVALFQIHHISCHRQQS